jgi:hypothetical protein
LSPELLIQPLLVLAELVALLAQVVVLLVLIRQYLQLHLLVAEVVLLGLLMQHPVDQAAAMVAQMLHLQRREQQTKVTPEEY